MLDQEEKSLSSQNILNHHDWAKLLSASLVGSIQAQIESGSNTLVHASLEQMEWNSEASQKAHQLFSILSSDAIEINLGKFMLNYILHTSEENILQAKDFCQKHFHPHHPSQILFPIVHRFLKENHQVYQIVDYACELERGTPTQKDDLATVFVTAKHGASQKDPSIVVTGMDYITNDENRLAETAHFCRKSTGQQYGYAFYKEVLLAKKNLGRLMDVKQNPNFPGVVLLKKQTPPNDPRHNPEMN